mmetsp:Transcript_5717/g.13873  ORF Transcript_5717/g.13873 Transcript_5717/m.13873 type:complete len:293 (+) Transcript_5717:240-1118(+)
MALLHLHVAIVRDTEAVRRRPMSVGGPRETLGPVKHQVAIRLHLEVEAAVVRPHGRRRLPAEAPHRHARIALRLLELVLGPRGRIAPALRHARLGPLELAYPPGDVLERRVEALADRILLALVHNRANRHRVLAVVDIAPVALLLEQDLVAALGFFVAEALILPTRPRRAERLLPARCRVTPPITEAVRRAPGALLALAEEALGALARVGAGVGGCAERAGLGLAVARALLPRGAPRAPHAPRPEVALRAQAHVRRSRAGVRVRRVRALLLLVSTAHAVEPRRALHAHPGLC